MSFRIAVARLWHEGNSFTPVATRLADFRQREWRVIVTTACQAPNDPRWIWCAPRCLSATRPPGLR